MDPGTAQSQLKNILFFDLIQMVNKDICFHCQKKIETEDDLSIEHKEPWLDSENPKELFWDKKNVTFSHRSCNFSKARRTNQKYQTAEERLIANRIINNRSYAKNKNRVVV